MTTSRLAARKTCGAPSSTKSSAARAFESLALSLVFDIDWSELLVITIVAIVVVGLGPDANHGPPANANFADYCGWRSLILRSGTLSCEVTNYLWNTLVLTRWATQKGAPTEADAHEGPPDAAKDSGENRGNSGPGLSMCIMSLPPRGQFQRGSFAEI